MDAGRKQGRSRRSFHAEILSRLFAREKRLANQMARLRGQFDRALLAARRAAVQHKLIAAAIIDATGLPPTADELERLESVLQARAKKATRRSGAPDRVLDDHTARGQDELATTTESAMTEPILKRRTVTTETIEYFDPQAPLDGCEVDGDDEDNDDECEDHEDLDGDEAAPVPAPAAKPRR